MNTSDPQAPQSGEIRSFGILAARMVWAIFGPLVLVLLAYSIAAAGSGWLTSLDLAFAIVTAVMLAARWVEYRSGTATTLAGEAATPQHLRRYAIALVACTCGLWLAANLLGNHLLR